MARSEFKLFVFTDLYSSIYKALLYFIEIKYQLKHISHHIFWKIYQFPKLMIL